MIQVSQIETCSNAITTMWDIASLESIVDINTLKILVKKVFAGTKNVNLDIQKLANMGMHANFS